MQQDELPLGGNVGPRSPNRREDVVLVQAALNQIRPRGGGRAYYEGRVDGRVGPRTEAAIARFQQDHGERPDGRLCPRSACHRKLAQQAKAELARRPRPSKPHLTFDGKRLCWVGRPFNGKCWSGVSGAKGFQSKEHQSIKDKGPLPEGRWRVRQDQYQRFDDIPLSKKLLALVGRARGRVGLRRGGATVFGWSPYLEPMHMVEVIFPSTVVPSQVPRAALI